MAKIVALVCECDDVSSSEKCCECGQDLGGSGHLVLIRNGYYLNPGLVCEACVPTESELD